MSTPADWLTPEEVAAYLDEPTINDNLLLSTATIKAAVERRRSDLWTKEEPRTFVPGDEVHGAAIVWAGLFYQLRGSPSGPAGYGDETMIYDALGSRRAEIMRLIGWRRPVAV